MYLSRFLKVISLFIILISLEIILFSSFEISDKSIEPIPNKNEYLYPVLIQGLTLQSFKGSQIIAKATAKELKINPRKFFIFNIRPFNELTLSEVIIEFYKNGDELSGIALRELMGEFSPHSNAGASSSKKQKFGAIKTGLITRAVINKIVLKIYNKNNLSKIIKASMAYVNFKRNNVIFQNATIENIASREIIKSRIIVLKSEGNTLNAPGKYVFTSPAGFRTGKDLTLNLQ